jgi:branched-chain amino acid transport system substrate-binding protein
MRIFRYMLVLAAALLSGGAAHADITVGVVTALSGSTASIGIPYARGVAVGMATIGEVGGQRIRLIQLDDQSDPTAAARNARKLIEEDKVDILIGSAGAPMSLAMVGISLEQQVPFIIIANALVAGERGAWTLTVPQPASLMVAATVQHMRAAGIRTVGYIGFSDAWGDLVYDALNNNAGPAGIRVLTNERYGRTDTSVTAQALRIVAARPDAILTGGSGTPGALPHLALAERGYRGPQYSTHAVINQDFIRVGGASVQGLIAPTGPMVVAGQLPESNPIRRVALDFRAAYQRVHNEPVVEAFSAYAYDGWLIFADAARRALATGATPGTPEFRRALRDAMVTTRELVGTHAIYTFTPNERYGVDERARVMVRLQGTEWRLLP